MKDKLCKHPTCPKKGKKYLTITIKGQNTGTVRVMRFCSKDHLVIFKEALIAHNRAIKEKT